MEQSPFEIKKRKFEDQSFLIKDTQKKYKSISSSCKSSPNTIPFVARQKGMPIAPSDFNRYQEPYLDLCVNTQGPWNIWTELPFHNHDLYVDKSPLFIPPKYKQNQVQIPIDNHIENLDENVKNFIDDLLSDDTESLSWNNSPLFSDPEDNIDHMMNDNPKLSEYNEESIYSTTHNPLITDTPYISVLFEEAFYHPKILKGYTNKFNKDC